MDSHVREAGAASKSRWVLEAIFIVVSVALGFALAQIGEERADRRLAGHVLVSLRDEVEHNLAILEPMVPIHTAWVEVLSSGEAAAADRSGIDVFFATRPGLPAGAPSPFPVLRRSAWDAAVSGGALRLIDYDVLATLSEIYRAQEIATDNVQRLAAGALSTPATFDPAERAASVRLLWLTLADIEAAERRLLDLYRQNLPAIRSASDPTR